MSRYESNEDFGGHDEEFTENDVAELKAELESLGWNSWVAEALAEQDKTPADLDFMSVREILDEVLKWNGVIGYTDMLIDALDNIRNME